MVIGRSLKAMSALLLFSLLLTGVLAFAQKITGDVSGTVVDSSGAAVSNAKITATNTATGEVKTASTSDTGFFRILELSPGDYKVVATAPGFKTSSRTAQVAISLVTNSDFRLEVGQVTETVEVQSVAPLVETEVRSIDGANPGERARASAHRSPRGHHGGPRSRSPAGSP